jgi:hypothetical protein
MASGRDWKARISFADAGSAGTDLALSGFSERGKDVCDKYGAMLCS